MRGPQFDRRTRTTTFTSVPYDILADIKENASMKAVIQGEAHISRADRKDLLSRISDDTDCVFMEGGEAVLSRSNLTPGYAFFLIGMIFYLGFIRILRRCRVDPLEDNTEKRGIKFEGRIDMEVSNIYSKCPKLRGSIFVISMFFIAIIGIGRLNPLLVSLLILISPFMYFGVIMTNKVSEMRDRVMADSIMEKSKDCGFEKIVISCGQDHVEGIATILENNEWDLYQYHSNFNGWSHFRLLDPRIWISWGFSILKCAYDGVQG